MSENQINAPVASEEEQQDINILKKDRLDKLADLRSGGFDPYQITKFDVTGLAAQYKAEYEADEAKVIAEADGDEEKLNAGLTALNGKISSTFVTLQTEFRFISVPTMLAQMFSRNSRKNGISAMLSA